jgi:hypothetical protein
LPPPKLPFAACIEKDANKNATRIKILLPLPKKENCPLNVGKTDLKKNRCLFMTSKI